MSNNNFDDYLKKIGLHDEVMEDLNSTEGKSWLDYPNGRILLPGKNEDRSNHVYRGKPQKEKQERISNKYTNGVELNKSQKGKKVICLVEGEKYTNDDFMERFNLTQTGFNNLRSQYSSVDINDTPVEFRRVERTGPEFTAIKGDEVLRGSSKELSDILGYATSYISICSSKKITTKAGWKIRRVII